MSARHLHMFRRIKLVDKPKFFHIGTGLINQFLVVGPVVEFAGVHGFAMPDAEKLQR